MVQVFWIQYIWVPGGQPLAHFRALDWAADAPEILFRRGTCAQSQMPMSAASSKFPVVGSVAC
jgi:hypothetical protein